MKRVLLLVLLAAVCLGGAEKKPKKSPFAMQVIESAAHRGVENIALDGRVRNVGEKTVHGLIILFDFIGTDGQVVTTQRLEVDDTVLEPGQESVYHATLPDPVRAVRYRVNATDTVGRDFKVTNPGPFVIE